jgi:hypothetical protein
VDEIEYHAVIAEGFDPNDPDVVAGMDLARWDLAMIRAE